MRLIARIAVVAVTAAIAFPFTLWLAETFHLDCQRGSGGRLDCVVESSKRGGTRVYKLDETMLKSAKLDVVANLNNDGSSDQFYRLRLVLAKGDILSQDGDPGDIKARVDQLNAFLATPSQETLRFTLSNRTYRLWLAALVVLAALVLTHDFSYKPKQ